MATSFIATHLFGVIIFILWELLVGASKAPNERKLELMLASNFRMILDMWRHRLFFLD